MPRKTLTVRVNADLVLDAGTLERRGRGDHAERVVVPPATTLFEQLLSYLDTKPDPAADGDRDAVRDGLAATALVLRWGSYLAVLLDHDKPLWEDRVRAPRTSRITDAEMARIAIESSAALAAWIALLREDGERHRRLAVRALHYLPMPQGTRRAPRAGHAALRSLAVPAVSGALVPCVAPRLRADVAQDPARVLANAFVNVAWRNGPVEDLHAGADRGAPLDRRRVTVPEERRVMAFAIDGLQHAMEIARGFVNEGGARSFEEQVLPYAVAELLLVTPRGWSLTERCREVRLRG